MIQSVFYFSRSKLYKLANVYCLDILRLRLNTVMIVIPSILTNNPIEAKELMQKCEGVVDRVSIDIIDGKYAGNKTIDPVVFNDIKTTLSLDFQLMVMEPVNWVEKCISAGADRIIGHVEHMSDQMEFVEKVTGAGLGVGLGLDLPTQITQIGKDALKVLDVILLMSVPAGFGGQEFSYGVIEKIKKLSDLRRSNQYKFKIHVDGGVTSDNIKDIADAGADEVSVGRRLFEDNLEFNLSRYLQAIK